MAFHRRQNVVNGRRGAPGRLRVSGDEAASTGDARNAAIALLARRDFSTRELSERLERRGFQPDAVRTAVEELLRERLLDDSRYAQNYVSAHASREGPVRIEAELRLLGLPQVLIDEALAAGPDWADRARQVRVRKFGPEVPREWAQKARQARFLQYRGFSSDHIRSALGADFDPD